MAPACGAAILNSSKHTSEHFQHCWSGMPLPLTLTVPRHLYNDSRLQIGDDAMWASLAESFLNPSRRGHRHGLRGMAWESSF